MTIFESFKKHGNKLQFVINDVDLSIVNAIRRIGISEIPNVALQYDPTSKENDSVVVHENTCALHNEFLVHRLSLVPFCFSAEEISTYNADQYVFKLSKENKGPKKILDVTTKDIKIYDKDGNLMSESFHDRIFPRNKKTHDHILIVKLKHGEKIDIHFKLTRDIGSSHARWSPVSHCTYKFILDDNVTEPLSLLDSQRHFKKNKYGEPVAFQFELESECALIPEYIFGKSIEILRDKVKNAFNVETMTITQSKFDPSMHVVEIKSGGVTLGNVLQSLIYNLGIRDSTDKRLEFIGFYQPHPLDQSIILKAKFSEEVDCKLFLDKMKSSIVELLETLHEEWKTFSAKNI